MIALIALVFALLTTEVFAPGVGISALSILAVVMTVWWRPRAAVVLMVVLFGLQDFFILSIKDLDPVFAATLRSLDEIALLAAGLRAAYVFGRGDRGWLAGQDWTFAIVFLASGVVSSVLHGGSAIPAAALGFALSCKFFGFILFASSVPWKEGDTERAITAAIWAMPVLLVIGFVGYLSPDEVIKYLVPPESDTSLTRGGMTSFMAPFPHPGVYGWAMAVGAVAAITRLFRGPSPSAVTGLSAGLTGVILSLRRKPLLALPIAMFAVLLRLPGRQRLRILVAALIVGGLLAWIGGEFVHATVEDTMSSYLDEDAAENSARGLLLLGSLDVGAQHFPLGAGFGRFGTYASVLFYSDLYDELGLSEIYGLTRETPYYLMDTYWPHVFAETGAIGLMAMALFMWRIWRRVRLLDSIEGRLAALLLVEALVESVAAPVFDNSLQTLVIAIPIGMALRSVHLARRQHEA
jgi:hypothetical protein